LNYLIIILLIFTIIVETAQQVFFKMAGRHPEKYYIYSALGILMYLIFFFIWLRILKDLPLGFALPIMGLNYVVVAIADYVFFKKKLSLRKYGGIMLIFTGFLLVWYGGMDLL